MSLKITAQQQVTVENTRQPRLKQRCVQKSRNILKYILWICFTAHRYILGTKGIHQAGPTRTQNGKMEPCGNYIMHTLGQLWGYIVLTVFTLHVHSHVLSAWCKGIVWTSRHSSCQPLRLGLVWIAIEFELISFQVKLFDGRSDAGPLWTALQNLFPQILIFRWKKDFLLATKSILLTNRILQTLHFIREVATATNIDDDWYARFVYKLSSLCLQCSE